MFNIKIEKVIYCYGEYSEHFQEMKGSQVLLNHGWSEDLIARENLPKTGQTLLILDE